MSQPSNVITLEFGPCPDPLTMFRERAPLVPTSLPTRLIVSDWLASRERRGISLEYRKTIRKFAKQLEEAHPGPFSELTASWFLRWFDSYADNRPRTWNNRLALCRSVAFYAHRQGYLHPDWRELEKIDRKRIVAGECALYSADELRRILKHAQPAALPLVLLVAFCGVRLAEAARLRWGEVNLERGHIRLEAKKTKTRSRRIAPIPDNAVEWLRLERGRDDEPVYLRSVKRMEREMWLSIRAAGVTPKRNGLRHSFISYRLALTESASKTALESGTSEGMVFKHYNELATPEQARAWFDVRPPDSCVH